MAKLAWLFLKLGATSFGGPAAHVAMMEEEFVHRRKWLSHDKFLDLIALTNLIPGPNSTELAIHLGYLRAGWWGFAIAGICFILPAFLIVLAVAFFYVQYASLPQAQHFLLGTKAVVLAVIIHAFDRFLKSVLKIEGYQKIFAKDFWADRQKTLSVFILLSSVYLSLQGFNEVAILLNCGLISLFVSERFLFKQKHELGSLFWIFLKVGSLLFGSGYVLLSFLQGEFVDQRQWLTQNQLLDAISVGQFTPGPVFTTATFIGYLLQGPPGAFVATLGIFLPAFFFVALSIPLYHKMNSSHRLRIVLNGVVAGSVGLLLSTLWTFAQGLFTSVFTPFLVIASLFLIWKTRIPTALLILGGGLLSFFYFKI
ncbi:MAG: chromate efflux transporter [Bdellovibrio sp.]|nr:chromate efflux transporter [Bdellovibrio sp.]